MEDPYIARQPISCKTYKARTKMIQVYKATSATVFNRTISCQMAARFDYILQYILYGVFTRKVKKEISKLDHPPLKFINRENWKLLTQNKSLFFPFHGNNNKGHLS